MNSIVLITREDLNEAIRAAASAAVAEAMKFVGISRDEDELWDAKQVGEYLKLSAYTVAHDRAYQRGFPKAIVLGSGPKAKRRWKSAEIKQWAGEQR